MAVFTWIGASIFGAGTFLAGLTAAGLQIAAGVVMSSLGRSASSGEQTTQKFGVQGRLQGGEDVPRSINLGWNCTAGSLVWHNTFGDGGTLSARVMAIGDLPIRELLYPIVDGVDCTLLKGETHANFGWPVAEYRKGGVDHLWIKFYDGTQTVSDPFLVSTFAADPNRPYQSTRVGNGVPYVIVFARAPERNDEGDRPLFQGIPTFKFVSNGVRWYNPALDSTVGGVGSHRWDNPATWGGVGDFNPIVQLYNVLRGVRYSGHWLYGMQGLSAARLPVANWIAGINAAQAGIDGPSGTEPTYRAGGEIQVGAQVAITAEALLTAANARLVENGGVYTVYVGPPGAPVMAFTDGDILSTEEQSFSPFLSLADTVNGMDASYPNPGEGWNNKKAPPLLRPDLEVQAGNRRLMASVALDLVPYPAQVQRLMLWALNEALRARRHTFVLGPEFRVIEPGDVVRWTSARNGYVDKLFRVDGVIYKWNLDVIVDLTEVDPADYDWDQEADYRPVIDGPLVLVGPKPMPMQGWQVFPATITDDEGRARRSSVEVHYASGVPSVDRVRVQVRSGDETGPLIFDSDSHPYADPWRSILQGQFPNNALVSVRGIFIGPPSSEWSGWFQIRTPDVKLTALDIVYGDINLDELSNQVEGYFDWMGQSIRELIEQAQAQAMLTADQEVANAMQFDEMRRNLSVVSGEISASFEETVTVAIVPMQGQLVAIADALTELSAANDGDVNTARIRFTAVSGPSGYSRVGIETRFDPANSGDFRLAGSYWDTPNNPALPTRRVEIAEQYVIAESAASVAVQPFIFQAGVMRVGNALVGQASIVDASISTGKIADAAITSAKIGSAQIITAKIADGAITRAKIGSAAIGSAEIENAAITSAKIGDLSVDTIKIANGAVTTFVAGSNFFPTVPNVNQAYYTSDNFVAGAFPVTMGCDGTFTLGTSGGNPDSNVELWLDNLTAGGGVLLDRWNNNSPVPRGQSARVRQLISGHTYRLRLQAVWDGTGSVTFTSATFAISFPKK